MKQFLIWQVVASNHGNEFKTPDHALFTYILLLLSNGPCPWGQEIGILSHDPQVLPLKSYIPEGGILDIP